MSKKKLAVGIGCFVFIAGVGIAAGMGITTAQSLFQEEQTGPKHIFLFIGDGMGSGVTRATEAFLDVDLLFGDFPVTGIMNTDNVYGEVTDSAAAATAMACGERTKNGRIGMDRDGIREWRPISEVLSDNGWAVGVLSSAPLNNATPAGFYGHALERTEVDTLAWQAVQSTFLDVLGGGGFALKEIDRESFLEEAENGGWKIADTQEELENLDASEGPLLLMNEGKYSDPYMEYEIDRRRMEKYGGETFSLADMTEKAIELLEKEDRFFLMTESAMIDTALHHGDLASAAFEVAALDDAVFEAVEFYNKHPNDTLIVVLADHETGGLTLPSGYTLNIYDDQCASWSRVSGYIRELLEEEAADEDFLDMIDHYLGLGVSGIELSDEEKDELLELYHAGDRTEIRDALFRLLQKKAKVSFSTGGHTGAPITVYAMGCGQEEFSGCFDNTEVFEIFSGWQ
ncbi:MAG: alkaline phosphatase [Eubacteriales bacterium]|nr:alkaline phosphatase [Eubacteriales bacterium]